jgi:hypothetical protein
MFLSLYEEVTNVLCVSLLWHDRYLYDSLILPKQTWEYPHQHLQQLLWCIVSVRLNLSEVEERKLLSLIYSHKKKSQGVKSGLHNVESVYFFYSNPISFIVILYIHCLSCFCRFVRISLTIIKQCLCMIIVNSLFSKIM